MVNGKGNMYRVAGALACDVPHDTGPVSTLLATEPCACLTIYIQPIE